MRALVGYNGFVGSNICRFIKFDKLYNSSNFREAEGLHFDELYFAAMPAEKWKVNKFPDMDNHTLNDIKDILSKITVRRFILISTVDIYDEIHCKHDEDYIPDIFTHHSYGKNRYLLEQFIKALFRDYFIFRLPSLFGMGLKKNILYDLMNNNNVDSIAINSAFQWYDMDWIYDDITYHIANSNYIVNLVTEPLETKDILKLFPHYEDVVFKNNERIDYDVVSKHVAEYFLHKGDTEYFRSKEVCFWHMKTFVSFMSISRNNLRVSNIYPKHITQQQFLTILKCWGIKELQVAPTILSEGQWDFDKIDSLLKNVEGLKVTSLQSITYGLNENIFDKNTESLLSHLKKVILLAYKHNMDGVVFGCPKTRQKVIDIDDSQCVDFFRQLADSIQETNVKIYIEPNSKKYVNFLNHIEDTAEIVLKIDRSNVKLMLDIGHLNKEELYLMEKYRHLIYNVDISVKDMQPFLMQNIKPKHREFIRMLKIINYTGKINLEMISTATHSHQELEDLDESLRNFIYKSESLKNYVYLNDW